MLPALVLSRLGGCGVRCFTRPAEQWAGWVGYLLEALDEHAQAADFEDVLRGVQESTTTRLEAGLW